MSNKDYAALKQETFNRIWEGFAKQDFQRSSAGPRRCYYRKDGLRCAIGILIPDAEYTPDLEGNSVCAIIPRVPTLQSAFDNREMRAFLIELQYLHDVDARTIGLQRALINFAAVYNLTIPTSKEEPSNA